MLAYVFWHWPAPAVEAQSYEDLLVEFHTELNDRGSDGYHGSTAHRVSGLPWVAAGGAGYEDRYLVDGSFALDPLNELAVSPALRRAHDGPALAAGGGAGGLYRLISGEPRPPSADLATWIVKPFGTRYPDFYAELAGWTESAGVAFWRRQMVLGPSTEFMLSSAAPLELPGRFAPIPAARRRVYPAAGS